MKDRISSNESANRSHAAASEGAVSSNKSSPAYQIDDRRAASVMQRKFRNLANGLASANIIQPKPASSSFQSKAKPFNQDSSD